MNLRLVLVASAILLALAWAGLTIGRAMDLRLVLVASPILLALAWAGFNIGRAAVGQLQLMIKRSRA